MATATRSSSSTTGVNSTAVEQVRTALEALPEKPKVELSLREAVEQMQESLKAALERGYRYEELAKLLSEQGIHVSALTLRQYLRSGKEQTTKPKRKPVNKRAVDAPVVTEQLALETTSSPTTPASKKPTPKTKAKRGQAKTSAAQTGVKDKIAQSQLASTSATAKRGQATSTDSAKA
jgi:hypothetical protein